MTTLGQTALPAAIPEEHGEGALDTSTKALPRFEGRALLVGWALGSLLSPALWEADLLDFFWLAVLNILLTMEAPIVTVEVGSAAEYLRMTIQRRLNLVFIAGVSIQDFIICNPARSTFGQKDLVAELDRGEYLATLDHIGVGFKDRVDLLGRGDLFSPQHTASRWIDDAVSQLAIMFDLLARLVDGQLVDHALAACGLGFWTARRVHNLPSDVDELAVWHIIELDGRSIPALQEAFAKAAPTRERPTDSHQRAHCNRQRRFVHRNIPKFHGVAPTQNEMERALMELA